MLGDIQSVLRCLSEVTQEVAGAGQTVSAMMETFLKSIAEVNAQVRPPGSPALGAAGTAAERSSPGAIEMAETVRRLAEATRDVAAAGETVNAMRTEAMQDMQNFRKFLAEMKAQVMMPRVRGAQPLGVTREEDMRMPQMQQQQHIVPSPPPPHARRRPKMIRGGKTRWIARDGRMVLRLDELPAKRSELAGRRPKKQHLSSEPSLQSPYLQRPRKPR